MLLSVRNEVRRRECSHLGPTGTYKLLLWDREWFCTCMNALVKNSYGICLGPKSCMPVFELWMSPPPIIDGRVGDNPSRNFSSHVLRLYKFEALFDVFINWDYDTDSTELFSTYFRSNGACKRSTVFRENTAPMSISRLLLIAWVFEPRQKSSLMTTTPWILNLAYWSGRWYVISQCRDVFIQHRREVDLLVTKRIPNGPQIPLLVVEIKRDDLDLYKALEQIWSAWRLGWKWQHGPISEFMVPIADAEINSDIDILNGETYRRNQK